MFAKFHIENGKLKLGDPVKNLCNNIVQDYTVMHVNEPGIGHTQEERQKQNQFNELMDMQLKTTPDHKYCAVFSHHYLYCDFYEQLDYKEEQPLIGNPNKPEYVKVPQYKYLFTLMRNTYRAFQHSHKFIVEFITHPITSEIMILFNSNHGQLSIYNMKGELIHSDKRNGKFISDLEIINNKYMIVKCWFWSPVTCDYLYNLEKLLTTPDYEPKLIWFEEAKMAYEVIDNCKIKFYFLDTESYNPVFNSEFHTIIKESVYTIDEYYDNHDHYEEIHNAYDE
jgi:hypothetical protein